MYEYNIEKLSFHVVFQANGKQLRGNAQMPPLQAWFCPQFSLANTSFGTFPAHANWPEPLKTHTCTHLIWTCYIYIFIGILDPKLLPVLITGQIDYARSWQMQPQWQWALQAADSPVIAHSFWQNWMQLIFYGAHYMDLVTYIYYCNWLSRNQSMSHILW